MSSPVDVNAVHVILGATGNTGSIAADFLLSKGRKVRVVGRLPANIWCEARISVEQEDGRADLAAALNSRR